MTRRIFLLALFVLLAPFSITNSLNAMKRVAFIMGNSSYESVAYLENAVDDAKAVANSLKNIGFEIVEGYDLSRNDFKAVFRIFAQKIRKADVVFLYYAGHGMQIDGENYFIPVDAKLEASEDLIFDAVAVDDIIGRMERDAEVRLVFLDSCRNNPFAKKLASNGASRSIDLGEGLAEMKGVRGTFVAYATQPGKISFDGPPGTSSPFSAALQKNISRPNIDIRIMMTDVKADVYQTTNARQLPWVDDGLIGSFILNPRVETNKTIAEREPVTSSLTDLKEEQKDWGNILDSDNPIDFIDFLGKHPKGLFAATARAQLRRIVGKIPSAKIRILPGKEKQPSIIKKSPIVALKIIATNESEIREKLEKQPISRSQSSNNISVAVLEKKEEPKSSKQIEIEAPKKSDRTARFKPDSELTIAIQKELNRIGCSVGQVDGVWGQNSIVGLRRYFSSKKMANIEVLPSEPIFASLKSEKSQICELICSVREVNRNNKCITKSCPAGQRLSTKGACYSVKLTRQRTNRRKPNHSRKCYTFNGRRICE